MFHPSLLPFPPLPPYPTPSTPSFPHSVSLPLAYVPSLFLLPLRKYGLLSSWECLVCGKRSKTASSMSLSASLGSRRRWCLSHVEWGEGGVRPRCRDPRTNHGATGWRTSESVCVCVCVRACVRVCVCVRVRVCVANGCQGTA